MSNNNCQYIIIFDISIILALLLSRAAGGWQPGRGGRRSTSGRGGEQAAGKQAVGGTYVVNNRKYSV